MEKSKHSGLILIIIAIIAAIIIFDPFGGKIEGEWLLTRTIRNGDIRTYNSMQTETWVFYDDGTMANLGSFDDYLFTGKNESHNYSYSKGRLALDGVIYECDLSKNEMTLTLNDGNDKVVYELQRKS